MNLPRSNGRSLHPWHAPYVASNGAEGPPAHKTGYASPPTACAAALGRGHTGVPCSDRWRRLHSLSTAVGGHHPGASNPHGYQYGLVRLSLKSGHTLACGLAGPPACRLRELMICVYAALELAKEDEISQIGSPGTAQPAAGRTCASSWSAAPAQVPAAAGKAAPL